ncbi:hypothetical protein TNCV_4747881 [Trichonephila clavipes]|nr:hypothetical protein TNCV_4747881 [Trichonephila clavipes]
MAVTQRTLRTNPFPRVSSLSYTGHPGLGWQNVWSQDVSVLIDGRLKVDRCVTQAVDSIVLPLLHGIPVRE